MAEWAVQTTGLTNTAQVVAQCQAILEQISSEISNAHSAISRQCPSLSPSCAALSTLAASVRRQSVLTGNLSGSLQQISQRYQSVEAGLCDRSAEPHRQPHNQPKSGSSNIDNSWVDSPLWQDHIFFNLISRMSGSLGISVPLLKTMVNGTAQEKKLLLDTVGKCGVIGGVIKTAITGSSLFSSDNVWKNLASTTLDGLKALNSYASVSDAQGVTAKWSAALGLNQVVPPAGCAFASNFSNTFSKSMTESFTTPLGIGITAATGIVEGFENYEEYKSGKITAGRAVAETVLETGTKIVVAAGAKALSAAVLGTLCGTVGAPALAIGAGAVIVTWGADRICQWATGLNGGESRKLDEFIADTVIDTFKPGGYAQKAVGAIGGAISSAANGVATGWKTVCSWFS